MESWLAAAILGVIQGISEFLPISSSGHLIIVSWFMNGEPLPLTLNIALHLGTLLSVLVYFWKDWLELSKALIQYATSKETNFYTKSLLPSLIVGSIPAAVIGLTAKDSIELWFHRPQSVILPLALVGIILWWVDLKTAQSRQLKQLTIKGALIIGICQAMALIPGVSRSGATITAGRLLKFNRKDAAKFSFLLGTPAMFGAALLESKAMLHHSMDPSFLIGIASSFLTGCITIKFLLNIVEKYGFLSFAIYRVIIAMTIYFII